MITPYIVDRSLTAELIADSEYLDRDKLVLEIQQALCAEYEVACIQDIPAGVLPQLPEDGETEQLLRLIVACYLLDGVDKDGYTLD